ncbi:MAG: RidA family protein [Desulfovibrio sp.]|jgi:2-iminobutanoate/2-iminopropanoate deaminase|nr:RidA family protein [Desulfovibrio sp.]
MTKEFVQTDAAPAAIGPYSQAVKANGFVFASGQIPLDPATGKVAEGGVGAQTRQAMTNLKNVLEAAGSSLEQVVKTTIFIRDMGGFGEVNEIYAEFVGASLPARSCVEVARLPKDVLVEVEAIALIS